MLSRSTDGALLLGRLLVAALFLPSGFSKLMAFSAFAAALKAKGLPYPDVVAGIMVAAEVVGPIALIIGLWPRGTALVLVVFTGVGIWLAYGLGVFGLILQPLKSGELFERFAVMGGLLFYFASGPGGWSRTTLR